MAKFEVEYHRSHRGSFPIAIYRLPGDPTKCYSFQRKRANAYVCTRCAHSRKTKPDGHVTCIRTENNHFVINPEEYPHICEQPLLDYAEMAAKNIYRGALQSTDYSSHTAAELDSGVLDEIRNLFPDGDGGVNALASTSHRKKAFNRRRVRSKQKALGKNKNFWWSTNAVPTRDYLTKLRHSIVSHCTGVQEQKMMAVDEAGNEIFGMPGTACYFVYAKKVLDTITNVSKENSSKVKSWDEFSQWMDELIASTFMPMGMLTASFKHLIKNAPKVQPELQLKQQQILGYMDEYWKRFVAEMASYGSKPIPSLAPTSGN